MAQWAFVVDVREEGAGGRRVRWRLGGERLDGYGAVLGDVYSDAAAVEQRHADYGDASEFVGINPVIEFMPEHFDGIDAAGQLLIPSQSQCFNCEGCEAKTLSRISREYQRAVESRIQERSEAVYFPVATDDGYRYGR